jgi:hypothetical protein
VLATDSEWVRPPRPASRAPPPFPPSLPY